jgi:4'-phosphopantetheinyl transferase
MTNSLHSTANSIFGNAMITTPWQPLPAHPKLQTQAVHVICADLQRTVSQTDWEILSPLEQARADRFKFSIHRQRFILAHANLREILSRYTSLPAAKIEFTLGQHGKPYLKPAILQFNLSHSEEQMLLAITKNAEIGIDIEKIGHCDAKGLANRFFSAEECLQLAAYSAEQQLPAFYQIWAGKEAYIKATGLGLSSPLKQFTVNLNPFQLQLANHETWSFQAISDIEGFAGAFATAQTINQVCYWRY